MPHPLQQNDARDGVPKGFLDLAHAVYRDDPNWIPEDPAAIHAIFSPSNPWLAQSNQVNLARVFFIPGKVRAAVFIPSGLQMDGWRAAFIGYFESINGAPDEEAAVISAAVTWARSHGAEMLFGPAEQSLIGRFGFRIDNAAAGTSAAATTATTATSAAATSASAIPFQDEPHHPARYVARFESLGFSPMHHFVTQVSNPSAAWRDAHRSEFSRLRGEGFEFKRVPPLAWATKLGELHHVLNSGYAELPGYVPFSLDAFTAAFGERYIRRACPDASVLAQGPDGELAGVIVAVPHYGRLLTQAAGESRVRLAELDFSQHAPMLKAFGPRTVVLTLLAVSPKFRQRGLMNAMIFAAYERAESEYETWLTALVRTDSYSRRPGQQSGVLRHYALMGKSL